MIGEGGLKDCGDRRCQAAGCQAVRGRRAREMKSKYVPAVTSSRALHSAICGAHASLGGPLGFSGATGMDVGIKARTSQPVVWILIYIKFNKV
jgi:hypothetical protein